MDDITITRSEYDALKAESAQVTTLTARVAALETEVARIPALEKDLEAAQIATKTAEDAAKAEKAEKEALQETARRSNLASDRTSKLGAAFLAALPDPIKARVAEQAATMSDEDWTARLEELAVLTKVQPTEGGTPAPATGTVTTGETASTQFGATPAVPAAGGQPARAQVQDVLGGLFKQTRRTPPQPAAKA